MKNFAGRNDADAEIEAELVASGITVERLPEVLRERMGEVKTIIMGWLHGWRFERAWRYWIAQGPGIPPIYAEDLHRSHGKEVRVDGNCTCPSPMEWLHGFAVGLYHVDSQDGLNALAKTIRRVVEDAACMQCGGEITSAGCTNCHSLGNTDTDWSNLDSARAEVVLMMGRWFLVVNGMWIAMQGDPCRDSSLTTEKNWTYEALQAAARKINQSR